MYQLDLEKSEELVFVGLKLMASGPIASWQIEEETVEALTSFISLGSKITADGEIKWHLLLGRKDMTNLDSRLKKQRHDFANKGTSSQSYGFPVVMYKCETWTIKEAEHWRTDAFELWCWRKLLRVP